MKTGLMAGPEQAAAIVSLLEVEPTLELRPVGAAAPGAMAPLDTVARARAFA
ncbi:MAG: hypothetical protein IV107_20100, partial [Paucibacter sp.]|nr:hypothetical protein [Roseateles sp.]